MKHSQFCQNTVRFICSSGCHAFCCIVNQTWQNVVIATFEVPLSHSSLIIYSPFVCKGPPIKRIKWVSIKPFQVMNNEKFTVDSQGTPH